MPHISRIAQASSNTFSCSESGVRNFAFGGTLADARRSQRRSGGTIQAGFPHDEHDGITSIFCILFSDSRLFNSA
jgi:hypothetical protein